MPVRIEETTPARLSQLARAWGVSVVAGQHPGVTTAAIEAAYLRHIEAEERRAMRRLRDGVA
jgi:hypothetical protein